MEESGLSLAAAHECVECATSAIAQRALKHAAENLEVFPVPPLTQVEVDLIFVQVAEGLQGGIQGIVGLQGIPDADGTSEHDPNTHVAFSAGYPTTGHARAPEVCCTGAAGLYLKGLS